MPEIEGAGAPQDDQQQEPDATAGAVAEEPKQEAPKEPSANKLIKDFAAARGITVEKLIEQFQTYEDASKTELEKLQGDVNRYKTEAESASTQLRELQARAAVQDAVGGMNTIDPATVVDLAMPHLTYGDDGKPENVDTVLARLKTERPRLFPAAAGSGDGGKRNGATPLTDDFNAMIRRQAGRKG